jgi:hypothetical protein
MLLGMHGARLTVLQVDAKVKDDHNPVDTANAQSAASSSAATGSTSGPRRSNGGASP